MLDAARASEGQPGLSEAEHPVPSEVIIDEPVRPGVDFSIGRVYRGPGSKA